MPKGVMIVLAVFAGLAILVGVITAMPLASVDSEQPAKTDTQRHKEARDSILPSEEEAEEIEDFTVRQPEKPDLSVTEVYDAVQLGMTEDEVWEIAGRPNMTSSGETEFGNVTNLVYSGPHSLDNVTVSVQQGVVKIIVLGEFDGERMDVKSKM